MYIPKLYRNNNIEEVRSFISENNFGILISHVEGRIWGTHIPLVLDRNASGRDVLHGHMARSNPQWKEMEDMELMVIFQGPHAYISPSWYTDANVPTWNYLSVHIYGKARIQSQGELFRSLSKLVDKHETHSAEPVSVNTIPIEVLQDNMGLVGFEIEITEIHSARKLSQNRNDADHHRIIEELEKEMDTNARAVANEMKKDRTA